jgi:hypothetical protein
VEFTRELEIHDSCWITLQASGSGAAHPFDDGFPQATTNPIWITVGVHGVRSSESAQYFMRWIDQLIVLAEAHPGWRSDKEKAHVLGQFREARQIYQRLATEGSPSQAK